MTAPVPHISWGTPSGRASCPPSPQPMAILEPSTSPRVTHGIGSGLKPMAPRHRAPSTSPLATAVRSTWNLIWNLINRALRSRNEPRHLDPARTGSPSEPDLPRRRISANTVAQMMLPTETPATVFRPFVGLTEPVKESLVAGVLHVGNEDRLRATRNAWRSLTPARGHHPCAAQPIRIVHALGAGKLHDEINRAHLLEPVPSGSNLCCQESVFSAPKSRAFDRRAALSGRRASLQMGRRRGLGGSARVASVDLDPAGIVHIPRPARHLAPAASAHLRRERCSCRRASLKCEPTRRTTAHHDQHARTAPAAHRAPASDQWLDDPTYSQARPLEPALVRRDRCQGLLRPRVDGDWRS